MTWFFTITAQKFIATYIFNWTLEYKNNQSKVNKLLANKIFFLAAMDVVRAFKVFKCIQLGVYLNVKLQK